MRIAVTRPREDAQPLKDKLENLGHEVIVTPLLAIVPRAGVTIPDRPWQAIAATSANGIRALPDIKRLQSIRMLTVGPQSLKAARDAGFRNAEAHGGDVEGLARYMRNALDPADGPILYLSGAETAGDLAAQLEAGGFEYARVVLYDAVPAHSLGHAGDALRVGEIDAVLLYSPRTARIWLELVRSQLLESEAGLPHYFCLSRNVAAVLPEVWNRHVAATPDEAAILRLLDEMTRTR